MAQICAGCRQDINDRKYLKCSTCQENYDLECANVSEMRFYNTMTVDHKKSWKCHFCRSKEPKADNSNTPIRPQLHLEGLAALSTLNYDQPVHAQSSTTDQNVTLRKKISRFNKSTSPLSDDDFSTSIQGNTPTLNTPKRCNMNEVSVCCNSDNEQISLQKFTSILQENNKLILSTIQTSIRNEINNTLCKIEEDLKQNLEKISSDQIQLKQELTALNVRIKLIEHSCRTLEAENEKLRRDIQNLQYDPRKSTNQSYDSYEKTFVLHGLTENYWETDEDVICRVVNIFYDLLNINLTDYIEEARFIGKRGHKRPLKIELISKRITKTILDNCYYLKDAGFSATKYLCQTELQERRQLNHALQAARQNGHHAIIKNKKLFINGKETSTSLQQKKERTDPYENIKEIEETNRVQQYTTRLQPPSISYLPTSQETNTTNTATDTKKNVNITHTNTNATHRNTTYTNTNTTLTNTNTILTNTNPTLSDTNETLTNTDTTNTNAQKKKSQKSNKPKSPNFRN